MRPKNINNYIVLPGCRGRQPLRAAGRTRELQLTTTRGGRIITMKSEPRTRLAPQVIRINLWQGHKVNRHLPEWRLSFLAAFAFREVSSTISVTVNFLIWKVIRISPTSFSEDGANRLRVNVQLFIAPLPGDFYSTEKPRFRQDFCRPRTPRP